MHIEALLLNKYYTVLFQDLAIYLFRSVQYQILTSRCRQNPECLVLPSLVFHGGWRTDLQAHYHHLVEHCEISTPE